MPEGFIMPPLSSGINLIALNRVLSNVMINDEGYRSWAYVSGWGATENAIADSRLKIALMRFISPTAGTGNHLAPNPREFPDINGISRQADLRFLLASKPNQQWACLGDSGGT